MNEHFYNRRKTNLQEYKLKERNAMIRTRLLLGSLALSHCLSALVLSSRNPTYVVSNVWGLNWWLPALLGCFALTMICAALGEMLNRPQRALHEFSASMLATTWSVIWAYSWVDGADYVTFLAPVHVFFIGWSVVSEAHVQRNKITELNALT